MGPHLLIFDLYATGHHASYVEWLVDRWLQSNRAGRLTVAVPEIFATEHARLIAHMRDHADRGLDLHLFERLPSRGKQRGLFADDREHGRILQQLIPKIQPDRVLLMYFDRVQLSLATALRFDRPVAVSGIYFRPSFHYARIGSPPKSLSETVRRMQKKAVLRSALRNPHLDALFCLDHFAVPDLQRLRPNVGFYPLPEAGPAVETRQHRGATDRKTFVLFGVLSRVKGVVAALDSLQYIPRAIGSRIRVQLSGPLSREIRDETHQRIAGLRETTDVEIALDDRFLSEDEIQPLLAGSDVILIPYQRHVGMSHVLVRAAAIGVPVLGPDYGLVGELIRRHSLGRAVDSTDPEQIAAAISDIVSENDSGFDPQKAEDFSRANTVALFADTILDHCCQRGKP